MAEECLGFFLCIKDIYLFIDEMHTLVGAGNAEGAMDAVNILKPYPAKIISLERVAFPENQRGT